MIPLKSRNLVRSLLILGIILTVPVTAWGQQRGQIPQDRSITRIASYTTFALVRFSPAHPSTAACGHRDEDQEVAIDWRTTPDAKVMYAAALLAFATGKLVGFGFDGCHGSQRRELYRLDMLQ